MASSPSNLYSLPYEGGFMRPVIGIPCYSGERAGNLRPLFGNNQSYVRAVHRAGGAPLLLPPLDDAELIALYTERMDGLLLSGGGDVDPVYYGQRPIAECDAPDRERDVMEMALTRAALAVELPILGICRGMQLLNIVRGGTLYQDLPAQRPETIKHLYIGFPGTHLAHDLRLIPGSRTAAILGAERETVNSFHHQAVLEPGEDVEIVGWAEDGVAEAMELRGYPFGLAVQYHPEALAEDNQASVRLFAAFVDACRERASR